MPLGLYVHIPFCSAICNYCNFNRGLFDGDLKNQYVAALLEEIRGKANGAEADTVFFGGGTPSLLEPGEVRAIIEACRNAFAVSADAEVTLEANPETVTPERLEGFRAAGVNRLSFGVQSFRDEELQRLSRLHSAGRAREAFGMARAAGFDNVSLDLMMWLPQQSVTDWLVSVEGLIGLGPEHASLYLLEIYPNAPLRDAMARGRWSVAPDEDAAEMYLQGMALLDEAGYEQYRNLERGQARPRVASQRQVLDRRGVARLRLWCALDPKRRAGEECCLHIRVHFPRRRGRTTGGRKPAAVHPGSARGGPLHGPQTGQGHRPCFDRIAVQD